MMDVIRSPIGPARARSRPRTKAGRRTIFRFLAGALLGLAAVGPATSALAAGPTIGVSMHFMRDDYADKLVDTIRRVAAGHAGAKVKVTDANGDPQKQINDMENLIVQSVDALIVVPIDERAILPAIRRARAADIPVVAITRIPDAEVLTTIGANADYANGKASGELLAKATGGRGKVAVVELPHELWRIDQRKMGFRDAIQDTQLEIVVRQSGQDQAKIQDTVSGILLANPDLDGIWCTFSNQIVGAADALRMVGRRDVALTGIDADEAILERIEKGWVTGVAAQFPAVHGRLAAKAAFDHLSGKPVKADYDVPVELVTADNVDEMREKIWGE